MKNTNKAELHTFDMILREPKRFCWVLVGIGAVTPLIEGLVVKLYLMSLGERTIPLSKAIYMLPFTLYWAIPFVLLAGFAYALLSWPQVHRDVTYWKRALIIGFGFVFGLIKTIIVFWIGWQAHGDLALVAAPFMVGEAIVLGLVIGFIISSVVTYFHRI